ncbi:MAG: DUF3307 domain-containing protein [Bacteroidaceae bacterium]|nr:DUF3307 domain-containing protein [Bacteroidaceae bacterium]
MTIILVLISLIICHYLADFQLTTPSMIAAKAKGSPVVPIISHAAVHALLIFLCLLIAGTAWELSSILAGIEFITHFIIDSLKGRLTALYPTLADMQKKPYWQLYGLDQFLHILVIIIIWYSAITS